MRRQVLLSKTLAASIAVAALVSSSVVVAQEEAIRVEELRAQLAAGADKKPSMDIDAFEVVEGDVEAENRELAAKEKEIMAKLGGAPSSASASTGFVVQGRELAAASSSSGSVVKAKVNDALGAPAASEKADPEALTQKEKELASLKTTNSELTRKLSQSQGKLSDSQRELKEARDRLMMAEAEIQRLSQIVERRGMEGLGKGRASAPAIAPAPVTRPVAAALAPKTADDLPVATVVVDKANLRTGPGMDNSSLMSVSRGTRLVIETRNGSWYRVFAPNGARAWVTGDVLSFSSSIPSESGIGSALRVRAYDPGTDREVKARVLN